MLTNVAMKKHLIPESPEPNSSLASSRERNLCSSESASSIDPCWVGTESTRGKLAPKTSIKLTSKRHWRGLTDWGAHATHSLFFYWSDRWTDIIWHNLTCIIIMIIIMMYVNMFVCVCGARNTERGCFHQDTKITKRRHGNVTLTTTSLHFAFFRERKNLT